MSSSINNKTNQIKSLLSSAEQMMGEFKERRVTAQRAVQYRTEVEEQVGILRDWMVENYREALQLASGKVTKEAAELTRELSHLDLRILNLGRILHKTHSQKAVREIQEEMNRGLDDVQLRKQLAEWKEFEKVLKVIGHEWGIEAEFLLGHRPIQTAGAEPGIMAAYAPRLVSQFIGSKQGAEVLSHRAESRVHQALECGADALNQTIRNWVLRAHNTEANLAVGKALKVELVNRGLICLSSGWKNHSVGVTIHSALDGKIYLYYCNRGREEGASDMMCWEIGNRYGLTPKLLAQMAFVVMEGYESAEKNARAQAFFEGEKGLKALLNLKEVVRIPKKPQKVNTCSWANTKGEIQAAAIAAAYDEGFTNQTRASRAILMKQAVHAGTAYLKKLERFGRSIDLKRLFSYDASRNPDLLKPFDHLRFISLAWQKLKTKTLEGESITAAEDAAMLHQISDYYLNCSYRVEDISRRGLSEREANRLKGKLLKAGEGAFAFINNQFFVCFRGKLAVEPVSDMNGSLKAFFELPHIQRHHLKPLFLAL